MQPPKSKPIHTNGTQQPASRSTSGFVSPQKTTRTHKDRNIMIPERQTSRGRVNERCSSNLYDLEACFVQLQEELKKTKDQASSSEFHKRQLLLEVEEGKRPISVISAKLKETNEQLIGISSSEDDRLQELCKISHERDRAWALELEAVRKHHSLDMAALTSAMDEIQKLKKQLEKVTESEAVQTKRAEFAEEEVRKLQCEIRETLTLAERLKAEARHCRVSESEVQARDMLTETQGMLETVSLSTSASHEVAESFTSPSLEMEQSENCTKHEEDVNQLKNEVRHLKSQVSELRAALDAAEEKYREEYIQSTLQIRNAYELAEVAKSESCIREAELQAELKRVTGYMEESNQKNENEKAYSSDKENIWAMELKKANASLAETTARLLEKGNLLQAIAEENEKMKLEIQNAETEKSIAVKHAAALAEAGKVSKSKVVYLTQEADRNIRRVGRLLKQLEAAQAANTEMEMELRRQKVQCDQWRKAAEAAAAILLTDSGKHLDKRESLDSSYITDGSHLGSAYSEDTVDDDDTSKKKSESMLQKMGVLWKKNNSSRYQG